MAVGLIFVSLFGFLWITQQRTIARLKMEADSAQSHKGETGDASSAERAAKPE